MHGTEGERTLRMGPIEWAMLLALSALWGGSFFFFKVLAAELPPFTIVLGRVGLAALALHLLLLARGETLPALRATWRDFLVMGLLNNVVPFSLIVYGETRITSGLASILNATTPVFAVLVAHFLAANERLSWGRGAGVLFGVGGVAVLIGRDALGLAGADLVGELAVLAGALSYALAGIFGRRFRALSPLKVATGQLTASTVLLIPLVACFDRPWALPSPSAGAWAALATLALFSTALAYLLYFRILAHAGATNLLLVTFLLPVSALLLDWLFLGERLAPSAFAGMALIALGLAAIDGRPARWAIDIVQPQDAKR